MLSTGVLMLIGMTVILGTFLIVFVIPFYREYYQVTKKEQREQEKANASNKSTNSNPNTQLHKAKRDIACLCPAVHAIFPAIITMVAMWLRFIASATLPAQLRIAPPCGQAGISALPPSSASLPLGNSSMFRRARASTSVAQAWSCLTSLRTRRLTQGTSLCALVISFARKVGTIRLPFVLF